MIHKFKKQLKTIPNFSLNNEITFINYYYDKLIKILNEYLNEQNIKITDDVKKGIIVFIQYENLYKHGYYT